MTKEQAEYFSNSTTEVSDIVISVTRAQAKLALLHFNRLHQIEQFIENMENGAMKEMIKIEWNDRLTFESNNQILLQLASQLLISNKELTDIFLLASTL